MLLSAENPQSNFIQTGEKRSFEYIRRSSAVGLGCFSWRQAGKQGHLLMQLTCYYIVFCSQSTTVTFQNGLTVSGITLHTTRCLVIWAFYSVKKMFFSAGNRIQVSIMLGKCPLATELLPRKVVCVLAAHLRSLPWIMLAIPLPITSSEL